MKKIGKNDNLREFKLLGIVTILIIFALWNINCKVVATIDETTNNATTNNTTDDNTRETTT